jgi:hypothetical protein
VLSRGHVVSDISRRGMRFLTFESQTTAENGLGVCRSRALFVIRS